MHCVMYFGSFGLANSLETFLCHACWRATTTSPFKAYRDGPMKLLNLGCCLKLTNVIFEKPVMKKDIPSLAVKPIVCRRFNGFSPIQLWHQSE